MPKVNVKDKRKQQLMDANIVSIAKRGIAETTIAHVSQGAGMSRGIVNFYFTSKEIMMQETCQFLAEEYRNAWQRAVEKLSADASPEEKLQALVAAQFSAALCNQKKLSVWVAFWGHASSHNEYKKIVAEADSAFIYQASSLYTGETLSADVFAYELYALVRGSWLHFLLSPQSIDRASLTAKCQDYVTRALHGEVSYAELPVDNAADAEAPKQKKKPKPAPVVEVEQAALGDLFAL